MSTLKSLRVALTADPELPVPPKFYGGIERIIDMLAKGLVERGHDVTLFAHADSNTAGRLVPWPGKASRSIVDTAQNAAILGSHVLKGRFDIVHSFARIASLTPLLPLPIPKLMSYQRAISRRTTTWAHTISRGTLSFTAISDWMMQDVADIGRWDLIPNGVPLDVYDFVETVPDDAPLVFLGRIEEIKGPHIAIEIAKRSGRRLIIAGNVPEEKRRWVDANVLRHVDGDLVQYVGPVDDRQKNLLLGHAAAFMMPILWDEPFGIVMAEAMACGTPVLGFNRGAVPEVVEHGVTGVVSEKIDALVDAVGTIETLSRKACRSRVERLYSQDAVVDAYIDVYQGRIGRWKKTAAA
jgi:glycosyltransferase involved in cell wall biosynthesis